MADILNKLKTASQDATKVESWSGTFEQYLELVKNKAFPNLGVLSHQRAYQMILASGKKKTSYFGQDRVRYDFFEDKLFGVEHSIDEIMAYISSAAQRTETARRMLLLWGPPSSGKSDLVNLLKRGLESWSRTEDGAVFAIKGSKMHENPFLLVPHNLRDDFTEEYDIHIEGALCPHTQWILDHELKGDFMKMPIERIYMSEAYRVGIGTWLPSDTKCITEDCLILTPDGLRRGGDIFASSNQTEKVIGLLGQECNKINAFENGLQPVYKVNLRGLSVEATHNHRFQVVNEDGDLEWCKVGDMLGRPVPVYFGGEHYGDETALHSFPESCYSDSCDKVILPQNLTKGLAKMAGYLIAEGYCDDNQIAFTNQDESLNEDFKLIIKEQFNLNVPVYYRGEGEVVASTPRDLVLAESMEVGDVPLEAGTQRGIVVSKRKFVDFVNQNFETNKWACEKCVPSIILNSSKENQLEFLTGLYLGDGTVYTRYNTAGISYSSCSERLVQDVQAMLLNMGIFGSMSSYRDKTYHTLTTEGVDALELAILLPQFMEHRGIDFDETTSEHKNCYESFGSLRGIIDSIRNCTKHSRDIIDRRYTVSTENGRSPTRKAMEKWVDFLQDGNTVCTDSAQARQILKKLNNLLSYRCIPVVGVEFSGYKPVFDIEVDHPDHAFIVNGLVSHNSQDISELVGSIDYAKIQEYGDEADPRVFNFDGELFTANRGIMEFIEGLKADEKFLRACLTATQEKSVKAPRFGLIYVDDFIIMHSIHPDEFLPIRDNGVVKMVQIGSLLDPDFQKTNSKNYKDKGIEVLSIDERTRQPKWMPIKTVVCHEYKGEVLRLSQKYGDVMVSPNHSVYDRNFDLFDAEEHADHDLLSVPYVEQSQVVSRVDLARELESPESHILHGFIDVNGFLYKETPKQATVRSGIKQQIMGAELSALLRLVAAYVAEGHISGDEESPTSATISQNSLSYLYALQADLRLLAKGTEGYINDRSVSSDKTSRLEIHSVTIALLLSRLCGRYSEFKRIPDFVFNLSYDAKLMFLNALVDGDGSKKMHSSWGEHDLDEDYLEKYFTYTTVSRELAAGITLLCRMMNINVSCHSRSKTSTGKIVYHITYVKYPRLQNKKSCESLKFNGFLYDIEVDCDYAHNFACGVGQIVCHNTNEEEFIDFMKEKRYEAYHDRMYIVKVPYNLSVSNEVAIYEKLLQGTEAMSMNIAPRTLEAAGMFAVLTRLSDDEADLNRLQKMKLYNGQHVKGYKEEQVIDLKKKQPREGLTGASPRFVIDQISAAISRSREEGRDYITALDVLRSLNSGVVNRDAFSPEQKTRYEQFIDDARKEWNDLLRNDIQKAFFLEYENEAKALCENYLDQIDAACSDTKPRDPITGEETDLDEKLMNEIETQIGITDSGSIDFRNEVLRAVSHTARKNEKLPPAEHIKFDYTQHTQLKEGIQKALFEERKGVIRMTVSSRSPDPEALERLNDVVKRMCRDQDYTAAAANELLKYASAHLFDK